MSGYSHHPGARPEKPFNDGAIPSQPEIADVEQEPTAVVAISVKHDGPIRSHRLPARKASTQTVNVPLAPITSRTFGKDGRRNRVLIVSVDNPFYYATTKSGLASASVTAAAAWPPNVPLPLENCDEVYLACAPVGTFSAATSSTLGIIAEFYAD